MTSTLGAVTLILAGPPSWQESNLQSQKYPQGSNSIGLSFRDAQTSNTILLWFSKNQIYCNQLQPPVSYKLPFLEKVMGIEGFCSIHWTWESGTEHTRQGDPDSGKLFLAKTCPKTLCFDSPTCQRTTPSSPLLGDTVVSKGLPSPGYTVFHYGSSSQLAKGSIKRVFHFDFSACPISFFISIGISPENMLDPRTREQERAPASAEQTRQHVRG